MKDHSLVWLGIFELACFTYLVKQVLAAGSIPCLLMLVLLAFSALGLYLGLIGISKSQI